jgi:hypothetical protein
MEKRKPCPHCPCRGRTAITAHHVFELLLEAGRGKGIDEKLVDEVRAWRRQQRALDLSSNPVSGTENA